jgi:hypothetical protein
MMDEPRDVPDSETPKEIAVSLEARERSEAYLILVEALRGIEGHLQALEQIRQENTLTMMEKLRGVEAHLEALERRREENTTATTESMHSVVFRIRALEQSQRGMQNQLQPLESERLRVGVGLLMVLSFLAGLAVGLAVWLF